MDRLWIVISFTHEDRGMRRLTKNKNMPNPNILERSPILIGKHVIQLIKRIQTLHNMSKNRMFPIEVINSVREGDKELTSTPAFCLILAIFDGGCNCHGNSALLTVFESGNKLGGEVPLGRGGIGGVGVV